MEKSKMATLLEKVLLNFIMMEMIVHSHGEETLKNYLIPQAMLSSRVDGDSHKWIDAGNGGKTDELIRKKKSLLLHFTEARSSSVHDVPLMSETRAVRRLHHSAEAICSELPQQSYHQCDQCSNPSCGDGVFSDERPSVKIKHDIIWNNKVQAQGESV